MARRHHRASAAAVTLAQFAHLIWHTSDPPYCKLQYRKAAKRVEYRHERPRADKCSLVFLPRVADRAALPVHLDATRGQSPRWHSLALRWRRHERAELRAGAGLWHERRLHRCRGLLRLRCHREALVALTQRPSPTRGRDGDREPQRRTPRPRADTRGKYEYRYYIRIRLRL